ncbi:MAG TPA: hypothetical protein VHK67_04770 [Rhabdochlamydiaceae bacterium]|jgi:hypothetical protein|nr:hypothetical protein [Rhabdochlamydiaceae bacterium]
MTTEIKSSNNAVNLPWQSLKTFTASITLSEKVWRVVNNLLFVAACLGLCATMSRHTRLASSAASSPAFSYVAYAVIALAIRRIISMVIGYAAYHAPWSLPRTLLMRAETFEHEDLLKRGFIIQRISLHKSGVTYDARIIGHKDTIANGKWSIHALGNFSAMELETSAISIHNKATGANTLLVNGPGVGHSKGYPTRHQMGAGFEAGIQFLEKEVKATHIAMQGVSLGGGMMAEAILAHQFDTSRVKYLSTSECTFSRLSDIAATFVPFIATAACFLTGAELDGVLAAEKLKKLGIKHIIIQHQSKDNKGTDGVIPDRVALAPALKKGPTRTFLLSPDIKHGGLPLTIQKNLLEKLQKFFEQA